MELRAPDYLVLVVEDLERALDFYVTMLGLPLGHRSGPYAQLDTGTTRLALYRRDAMEETLDAYGEEIIPALEAKSAV
jgi:catechol 2,3-dioxygenase-like lactoylglutathione lyase family enzyme